MLESRNEPGGDRRRSTVRTATVAAALAVALAAAACAPDPGPGGPGWHATRFARTADASGVVNHVGAWTDDDWFGTVRITSPTSGSTTGELRLSPRSGPTNGMLDPPQVLSIPTGSGAGGPIGEHVLAVVTSTGASFYRETASTWAAAGSIAVPTDYLVAAVTDRWLVARRAPGSPSGGDSHVLLYQVDASGPVVTATLHTTLDPDPTWTAGRRDGFGASVAIDGDLLAVTATDAMTGAGPLVRVYRATAGTWSLAETLGDGIAIQRQTGSIAVDDGPTVDRVVLSPFITAPATPAVDVWADSGSGFSVEQHIELSPTLTDTYGGNLFGSSVAIDGDLLAITSRATTVPSAQVGHDPVTVGHVQLYRRTAGWHLEHEAGLFTDPYDAGVRVALPYRLQVADGHVAALVLVTPDPPPGCTFPCFNIGMEAWSLDRY